MGKPKSAAVEGKRLSAAQGRALVEDWRRSGLRKSRYSRERGVPEHILRYWSSRETEPDKASGASGEFYVMKAPAPALALADNGRRASGAIIIVLPAVTPEELIQTVRGLREGVGA